MSIAPIATLDIVQVAIEKLISRVDGLPGVGVIYGPPGRGKTVACVSLCNTADAYYVQMRSAWNRKALLEKILLEMGITPDTTIPKMLDQVCEQLALSRRPLIIDEADFALRSNNMLELVRDIYEGSQGTLLLVGEENMPTKLKKWERMHSRVLAWIPAQPVSVADAVALAQVYCHGINVADDMLRHLVEIAHGSVRRVCVNLANIREEALVAGECNVNLAWWDGRTFYTGESPIPRREA